MPTFNEVDAHGETDMGWAVSRVTQRHPVTHEPIAVTVQCKGCHVAFEYLIAESGGITSGFDHAPGCQVFAGIHSHTVHELNRPRS